MKSKQTARPCTFAMLLAATVLPATPVVAQEVATPPPVTATVPQPDAPAAPVGQAPAPAPATVFAPPSEVAQPLPVRAAPPAAEVPAPTPRITANRAVKPTASTHQFVAPVAVASAAAAGVADTAPIVSPPPAPPAVVSSTPDGLVNTDVATTSTTITDQTPWMWIVGGLVALGAILTLLFSRRRRSVEEAVYEEPRYVAPPLMTAPTAENDRPWIGLSLQPTRVNAREGDDLVEYNLIVENAGDMLAHDVKVSSFLIDARTKSTEMETALIVPVGETQSRFIDLAPGTSVPIASTMPVPYGVRPCIIAEARYPLPGGGEGHIAARFMLKAGDDDRVEAQLDKVLERV